MKKLFTRILLLSFSFMMIINLSGCAKVYKGKNMKEIYPLNYDYFWDRVFVQPIAWLLDFITDNTGSFALAILLTTIIVRTILFPIYTKSNDTSLKMQAIQPEIKKLNEKYAGKTDPESRNKQQIEMMKLYKDNNVNMLAGCVMPFLQMPIFLAMYNAVVKVPVTFGYTASRLSFLGLDLSKPGPFYFLPILVATSAVLLQFISMYGLTAEAKSNPTMKMMMWLMPGMMFVFSFSQASALSVYWIVGNIYSTLQIILVKKPFKKNKDNDVIEAKYTEVKSSKSNKK
ncbi:YidC/Oxa1 family membrane protein insertase [Mycoplasmatota bacterium]|nr:YidC/Oxa1 family membrane protein insertase [Mycoplasmatota bacterium]